MKVVLMGTPDFAVNSFRNLFEDGDFEVVAVVTQPDRKVGRKRVLTKSPVKLLAEKYGVRVLQPNNKAELFEAVKDIVADFFVVVAYGMILEKRVLDLPKIAPINVHGSLLPKYRGASPVHEALLNGDVETGVSIMKMDEGLDDGPVLLLKRMAILENELFDSVAQRMSELAGELLPRVLKDVKDGVLTPIVQSHANASYCKKIVKEDGEVFVDEDEAVNVWNRYRAYHLWPGLYLFLEGVRVKLLDLEFSEKVFEEKGFVKDGAELFLSLKGGALKVNSLQFEGKKPIFGTDYVKSF